MNDLDFQTIYNILRITVQQIADSYYGKRMALKGGTALITKMIEQHREDLLRKTTDIDLHIADTGLWDAFCNDLETILNANNYNLIYKLINRRAMANTNYTCDSLKISVTDRNNITLEFKIDVNCKPWSTVTLTPLITLNNMYAYDNLTMLADKIHAVSTKTVYRRIKDMYDICVLAQFENYKSTDIIDAIERKRPEFYTSNEIIPIMQADYNQLEHAYIKFTGIRNKPDFKIVCNMCKDFLLPIYLKERNLQWNLQQWIRFGI